MRNIFNLKVFCLVLVILSCNSRKMVVNFPNINQKISSDASKIEYCYIETYKDTTILAFFKRGTNKSMFYPIYKLSKRYILVNNKSVPLISKEDVLFNLHFQEKGINFYLPKGGDMIVKLCCINRDSCFIISQTR